SIESRRLAQELLWLATPYGVLAGTTRIYAVLAESEGRFARTSLSPLLTAILSIVILVAGGARPGILVVGLTVGAAAELIFNASALRATRYRAIPRVGRFSAFESALVAVVWPLSLGAFLQGLTVTV